MGQSATSITVNAGSVSRGLAMALGLLLIFAALALLGGFAGDYVLELAFRLLVLMTLAEAWNLLAGYGGLVSLGTASFVGIGAYVLVGAMNRGAPLAFAWAAAGLAGALLALLVSRAVFRLRGLYFTVGTLALAEALRLFMVNYQPFGGAIGLFLNPDAPSVRGLFLLALGLFAFATLLMQLATSSRYSILLRAVRDDEDAAAQMGVRPFRIKLLAFIIASALMGLAGALQGLKLGAVEPYGMFGLQWTVSVLAIVIIGGQGQRLAAVIGALFVVALGEVLASYPAVHLAITGLILILVIRFAPQGLAGLITRLGLRLRAATRT
jgi:branched-chain amino acid transport system permease protein